MILRLLCLILFAMPALAGDVAPRPGWKVHPTPFGYAELLARTKAAIKAQKMGLVTQAGPTDVAAKRGETIPGNRVLGVFRNDFAVRAVRLSAAAMIEAPIRLYVTENTDGTATLSYKTPSHIFAAYADEGGADLAALAAELDVVFAAIAATAVAP
ncbi:MAG: DUF302 domain-containing protein [Pseudomonadota bacterium]